MSMEEKITALEKFGFKDARTFHPAVIIKLNKLRELTTDTKVLTQLSEQVINSVYYLIDNGHVKTCAEGLKFIRDYGNNVIMHLEKEQRQKEKIRVLRASIGAMMYRNAELQVTLDKNTGLIPPDCDEKYQVEKQAYREESMAKYDVDEKKIEEAIKKRENYIPPPKPIPPPGQPAYTVLDYKTFAAELAEEERLKRQAKGDFRLHEDSDSDGDSEGLLWHMVDTYEWEEMTDAERNEYLEGRHERDIKTSVKAESMFEKSNELLAKVLPDKAKELKKNWEDWKEKHHDH